MPTAPCVTACPLQIDIPEFISALQEGDVPMAGKIMRRRNPFPAVCGRICSQESHCESKCVLNRCGLPVSIAALERYVGDWMLDNPDRVEMMLPRSSSGQNIAVIGSGPAGLSAAASLVMHGHGVKIYELMNDTVHVLVSEIPEFRLSKKVLIGEVARILSSGVKVECNVSVGKQISFRQLFNQYDAIYLAHGSRAPVSLGIPGERLSEVYSARDYLVHVSPLMESGSKLKKLNTSCAGRVVVIGGGNTAVDCARVAIRLEPNR
jgi:glutamate synthase (NADPH/NADH) small chain